jgi:hypothetical protein
VSYPKIMDAAVPPLTAPAGIEGVMGYIGGPRATRVWTVPEWLRFQHLAQFPIYVPDLSASATIQAQEAVILAKVRGWAAFMPEPDRRVIVIDMEASADREWYDVMAAGVEEGGFVPACYGSLSTVLGNAAQLVIAAAWSGGAALPPVPAGQTIAGLQWEPNVPVGDTMVDYSVFTPALFARGGVGARHGG